VFSTTPDILSIPTALRGEVLSQSDLEVIKEKTLYLLADVGIHFPSSKALRIFADHGAIVDLETEIVKIPPDLVLKAMATAPNSFILGGREERFDLHLDGSCSYLSTDGTGVHVIDFQTREKRDPCKADVALMARICDALSTVSFYWPMVSAKDFGQTASLHQCHAGLTNTLKHVRGGTTMHPRLARFVVEMAETVVGSSKELRQRPPINANICTISPLGHDKEGIESALVYAEAGIPISFMAMPTMGSTAPASPLGALVMGDAEVISAMTLIQLAYPGAPVFHAVFTSLMDPRTGGYISEVPTASYPMARQLARAWNVPCLGGARVSGDAPTLGWQSGYEVGFGSAMTALAGGDVCGMMGLVGSATTLYPEEVILDNDAYHHIYELLKANDLNQLDSALEQIIEVGQRSHFLAQKHTRKHIRDFRLSPLQRQRDSQGEHRDAREVALEKFKEIEANHHPQPLSSEVLKELDKVIQAAEGEVENLFGK